MVRWLLSDAMIDYKADVKISQKLGEYEQRQAENRTRQEVSKFAGDLVQQGIEKYPDFAHFYGPIEEGKIAEAEALLRVKFPISYRQFLLKYGVGGFEGLEVHGIGKGVHTGGSSVVFQTLYLREEGYIPNEFIYVMCADEWDYMIDTSQMKDNEAPVVEWLPGRAESEQSSDYWECRE